MYLQLKSVWLKPWLFVPIMMEHTLPIGHLVQVDGIYWELLLMVLKLVCNFSNYCDWLINSSLFYQKYIKIHKNTAKLFHCLKICFFLPFLYHNFLIYHVYVSMVTIMKNYALTKLCILKIQVILELEQAKFLLTVCLTLVRLILILKFSFHLFEFHSIKMPLDLFWHWKLKLYCFTFLRWFPTKICWSQRATSRSLDTC